MPYKKVKHGWNKHCRCNTCRTTQTDSLHAAFYGDNMIHTDACLCLWCTGQCNEDGEWLDENGEVRDDQNASERGR